MYEEIFRSPTRPFRATPDARFYFPHESVSSARQTIVRAVERAEGPVLVLGGAGLGKSLLAEMISIDLQSYVEIVKLNAARLCSRRALLQNILFELQLPYRDLSEGELRLSILDRLEPAEEHKSGGILIVVDEAHTLPTKLLEELRLLSNFARNNQPRAQLVLIGGLSLEDVFASPQMESFNQRLAARCYLTPMTREQTNQYIEHQIKVAGYDPAAFITSEGMRAVYAASEGVPRLANQIMDHSLVLAVTNHQCPISAALVEDAWADLQQLPVPWQTAADRQAVPPVAIDIEFGSLVDEPDEELNAGDPTRTAGSSFRSDTLDALPEIEYRFEVQHAFPSIDLPTLEFEDVAATRYSDRGFEFSLVDTTEFPGENNVIPDRSNALSEARENPVADRCRTSDASGRATESSNLFAAFSEPSQVQPARGKPSRGQPSRGEPSRGELAPGQMAETASVLPRPELIRPKFVFEDLCHPASAESEDASLDCLPLLPQDSYFANKPTDEKLIAFEDEQNQFASTGLWGENFQATPFPGSPVIFEYADPENVSSENAQVDGNDEAASGSMRSPCKSSSESYPPFTNSPQSLFGEDFEEEYSISELAARHAKVANDLPPASSTVSGQPESVKPRTAESPTATQSNDSQYTFEEVGSDHWEKIPSLQKTNSMQSSTPKTCPPTIPALAGFEFIELLDLERADSAAPGSATLANSQYVFEEVRAETEQPEYAEPRVALTPLPARETPIHSSLPLDRKNRVGPEILADSRWTAEPTANNPLRRQATAAESAIVSDAKTRPARSEPMFPASEELISATGTPHSVAPWSVDIMAADTGTENAIHREIEDLVSLLNFQAFSNETFSLERISLESETNSEQTPESSAGQRMDAIYALHQASNTRSISPAEALFSDEANPYDDDRDLLVIEDDIPAHQHQEESVTKTVTKTTPYTQLFAKLRK